MKKLLLFGLFTLITQNITLYPSQIEGYLPSGRGEGQPRIYAEDQPGMAAANQKGIAEKTDAEKSASLIKWAKDNIDENQRKDFESFLSILLNFILLNNVDANMKRSEIFKDESKKNLALIIMDLSEKYHSLLKSQADKGAKFVTFEKQIGEAARTKGTIYFNAIKAIEFINNVLNAYK